MHSVEDKKVPLSLKVSPQLKTALEAFAKKEKRPVGNLGEILLDWSSEQLRAAGDTVALMRAPGVPKTNRVSRETHEQLYTALRIILERAPSAIIEETARKLSKWAAEYGQEK
jgi:hypothetical protein